LDWIETTRRILTTRYVGQVFEAHAEIESTNRRALEWAAEGISSGAVVVADHQTRGRGRLGRSWEDGPGTSLLLSVIVRPQLADEHLSLVPLAGGLAVLDAVRPFVGGQNVKLKWPNDVLVGGLKCAGILVESVMTSGSRRRGFHAVMGMGINVNQDSLPADLSGRACSLRMVTGRVIPRPILLAGLLESLEQRLDQLEADPGGLVSAYEPELSGLNQPVVVSWSDGQSVRGTSLGIDASGALRVWTESGERLFTAADVTLDGRSN
jgi:BirA family transcriptional regulator, biotin operon repressor / biotin---[acetyl-CoA-carboxylase] ligase